MFEDITIKNVAISLIFPSFGSAKKTGLGKSWQIVDFMFTFEGCWYLEGLSIKWTSLESGHFSHAAMVSTL